MQDVGANGTTVCGVGEAEVMPGVVIGAGAGEAEVV